MLPEKVSEEHLISKNWYYIIKIYLILFFSANNSYNGMKFKTVFSNSCSCISNLKALEALSAFGNTFYKMELHHTCWTFSFVPSRWSERWVTSAFWWIMLGLWRERSSWMPRIPWLKRRWRSTLWLTSGSVWYGKHAELSARISLYLFQVVSCVVGWCVFWRRLYLWKCEDAVKDLSVL